MKENWFASIPLQCDFFQGYYLPPTQRSITASETLACDTNYATKSLHVHPAKQTPSHIQSSLQRRRFSTPKRAQRFNIAGSLFARSAKFTRDGADTSASPNIHGASNAYPCRVCKSVNAAFRYQWAVLESRAHPHGWETYLGWGKPALGWHSLGTGTSICLQRAWKAACSARLFRVAKGGMLGKLWEDLFAGDPSEWVHLCWAARSGGKGEICVASRGKRPWDKGGGWDKSISRRAWSRWSPKTNR